MIKTVEWTKDGVRMLDQRLLPSEETYLMLRSYDCVMCTEVLDHFSLIRAFIQSRVFELNGEGAKGSSSGVEDQCGDS